MSVQNLANLFDKECQNRTAPTNVQPRTRCIRFRSRETSLLASSLILDFLGGKGRKPPIVVMEICTHFVLELEDDGEDLSNTGLAIFIRRKQRGAKMRLALSFRFSQKRIAHIVSGSINIKERIRKQPPAGFGSKLHKGIVHS